MSRGDRDGLSRRVTRREIRTGRRLSIERGPHGLAQRAVRVAYAIVGVCGLGHRERRRPGLRRDRPNQADRHAGHSHRQPPGFPVGRGYPSARTRRPQADTTDGRWVHRRLPLRLTASRSHRLTSVSRNGPALCDCAQRHTCHTRAPKRRSSHAARQVGVENGGHALPPSRGDPPHPGMKTRASHGCEAEPRRAVSSCLYN
jgi:hypothetical protein